MPKSKPKAVGGAGDYLVTVCDSCLRASCWHADFPCDRYLSAGTKTMRASELRALDREHPKHYGQEMIATIEGKIRPLPVKPRKARRSKKA